MVTLDFFRSHLTSTEPRLRAANELERDSATPFAARTSLVAAFV